MDERIWELGTRTCGECLFLEEIDKSQGGGECSLGGGWCMFTTYCVFGYDVFRKAHGS